MAIFPRSVLDWAYAVVTAALFMILCFIGGIIIMVMLWNGLQLFAAGLRVFPCVKMVQTSASIDALRDGVITENGYKTILSCPPEAVPAFFGGKFSCVVVHHSPSTGCCVVHTLTSWIDKCLAWLDRGLRTFEFLLGHSGTCALVASYGIVELWALLKECVDPGDQYFDYADWFVRAVAICWGVWELLL